MGHIDNKISEKIKAVVGTFSTKIGQIKLKHRNLFLKALEQVSHLL